MLSRNRILMASLPVLLLLGMGAGINSSVRVADGEDHDGDLKTLNGGITIGDNARVRGACRAVNGGISVGRSAEVDEIASVNGSVSVGERAVIRGGASSVNGPVSLDRGASAQEVSAVNGSIKLSGAEVTANIETVNGDISLRDGATVGGDVIVRKTHGNNHREHDWSLLRINIDEGSVVRGSVIVEDPDRPVEVHVRGGGRVQGRIENAKLIED